ncbi:MAG: D-alanyl-D-alanine carboxypeptidase [Oscillospiraceae bacterium]|nr:D-alanyl-D-alanine carboxypeptidase [Oscillospiraceae bacterium]
MRRVICVLLCVLLCLCRVEGTEALSLSAGSAILMDADTGEVLYEKDADRSMRIASTTKILTALVVLEEASPCDVITVTQEHMVEGSSMYLEVGEQVTVQELLYGLLLCSGNDAALALTEVCGGEAAFVEKMNALAQSIGMENSSFRNPNGLDADGHRSTARDMARLAAYAAEDPAFVRLCSTTAASVAGRSMSNHNKLLKRVEGCIGMKTGYTKAAGRTLVSCAEREGRCLVAVTLNAADDWSDHEKLYEWGFGPEG